MIIKIPIPVTIVLRLEFKSRVLVHESVKNCAKVIDRTVFIIFLNINKCCTKHIFSVLEVGGRFNADSCFKNWSKFPPPQKKKLRSNSYLRSSIQSKRLPKNRKSKQPMFLLFWRSHFGIDIVKISPQSTHLNSNSCTTASFLTGAPELVRRFRQISLCFSQVILKRHFTLIFTDQAMHFQTKFQ